ncbi:MAG: cytoskeletal protein binding protein [Chaenotheca gracillima]|nr:MAG: cytoskeletal protein binding protein [Chaenotheca gracillima]
MGPLEKAQCDCSQAVLGSKDSSSHRRVGWIAKCSGSLFVAWLFTIGFLSEFGRVNDWLRGRLSSFSGHISRQSVPAGFSWEQINPTPHLEYHSCFDGLECARLEVPLDWNRTDGEGAKAAIAVARLPAKVPVTDPRYGGPVLINPGGPGGSGVMLLMREGKLLQQIVDANVSISSSDVPYMGGSAKYFDIIGFDPRGVNNTTPTLSCFPNAFSKQAWAVEQAAEGMIGSSEEAFALRWARAKALFEGCSQATESQDGAENQISQFMNTSPVARDMVELVERHGEWREKEAKASIQRSCSPKRLAAGAALARTKWRKGEEKLQYWGFSYGTILGATFAAMYPDRVGRVVIDGVADAPDYYRGGWLTNLMDTDAILDQFCKYCHEAGPERCALYSDSPDDIKIWFNSIVTSMKGNPLPVEALGGRGPDVITYSDVRGLIKDSVYKPVERFSSMAQLMVDVSSGNGSSFADHKAKELWSVSCSSIKPDQYGGLLPEQCRIRQDSRPEVNSGILCADGESISEMSPELYKDYWKFLRGQSALIGDFWAEIRMSCVGWKSRPKWRYSGPIAGNTSHPLLLIGNTYDPVTPLRNAFKTAKRFPGSVVLHQDSEGVCTIPSLNNLLVLEQPLSRATLHVQADRNLLQHCSLAAPSVCTAKNVRKYFQTGELPKDGTICDVDEKPLLGSMSTTADGAPLSRDDKVLLGVLKDMVKAFPS